mgnify:CR=1 FL=1
MARRALRILGWTAAGLLGLVVVGVLAAWAAANTGPGRRVLTGLAEDALSRPGAPATVDGLHGTLPGDIRLDTLVLRDRQGAWLTVEDARLAWSPLALVQGRLHVTQVRAGRVAVPRAPAGPDDGADTAPETPPDLSVPRPPLPVRLDTLDVDAVELGKPLVGQEAELTVTGEAAAPTRDALRTRLRIARRDAGTDSLTVDARFRHGPARLDLDTRVRGEPGGLIASLAGLPTGEGVAVTLAGEGPLRAWDGTLDAAVGTAGTELDVRIDGGDTLRLTGPVRPGRHLPPDAADLLGTPLTLDLALQHTGGLAARLDGSAVTTPKARVALSGTVDAGAGRVDAIAEAGIAKLAALNALLAPARLSGFGLTVSAHGSLGSPKLTTEISAGDLATPEGVVERATLTATHTPEPVPGTGPVSGTVELTGVAPAAPSLAALTGERVTGEVSAMLDADAGELRDLAAEVAGAGARLTAEGRAGLNDGTVAARLSAVLPALDRLAGPLGTTLGGKLTLKGEVSRTPEGTVSAKVRGDLANARWPDPAAGALLGETVSLASELRAGADGALAIRDVKLDGVAARVGGDLRAAPDGSLTGGLSLHVPELAPLGEAAGTPLAGALTAELVPLRTLDSPAAALDVRVAEAAAGGTPLGEVTLTGEARADGPSADLRLAADGTPAGPVTLETGLTVADGALTLTGVRGEADGITVASERVGAPFDGAPIAGELRAEIASLRPVTERVGQPIDGRGALTLTLGGEGAGQAVALAGKLHELALPGGETAADVVRLDARVTRAFSDPDGRAGLHLTGGTAGPAKLSNLVVRADGSPEDATLTLAADGTGVGAFALSTTAGLQRTEGGGTITLTELSGSFDSVKLALPRPATVRLDGGTVAVDDLALAAQGGELAVDGKLTPDRVAVDAALTQVPLALLGVAMPSPRVRGTLDGSLALSGPREAPTGSVELTGREVRLPSAEMPPLAVEVSGEMSGGIVDVAAEVAGLSDTPARFTGEIPVAVNLGDAPGARLRRQAPLSAELTWAGRVKPLMPLVPVSGHELDGAIALEGKVTGTPADPAVQGTASLTEGRYENLTTGTLLRDLTLRLTGSGEEIRVEELTAKAGKGRISGSGRARLADGGAPARLDVELTADDATLVRRDDLKARTDADLSLTGPVRDLQAAGTVTVTRGTARIPEGLPPSVQTIDVTWLGEEDPGGRNANEAGAAPPAEIGLDIAVKIPNRFFVRGRGVETEWQGALDVGGTASQPRVVGELSVVRGRVSVLNRTFTIADGTISFDGGAQIDPRVDVRGTASTEELEATVRVQGRAAAPELSLSSVPPLPEDAILSQLLFGKDPSQLGGLEAAQLGAAVAELTQGGGGPGILDRVRGALGVDVLRLGGSGGGAAVTAGTYVTQDVFVGVEQGLTPESGNVQVELGVTDNISVESNVGREGQSEVGVKFKWDY